MKKLQYIPPTIEAMEVKLENGIAVSVGNPFGDGNDDWIDEDGNEF